MTAPALPPIGGRLREARQQRGLTVRGLARAVDVSASLISQIETGKSSPSVSTLYAITAALGISIEDVFGDPSANTEVPAVIEQEDIGAVPSGAGSVAHPSHLHAVAAALPVVVGVAALAAPTVSAGPEVLVSDQHPQSGSFVDRSADSLVNRGLRMLQHADRLGPVVTPAEREVLHLDSGVTWELLGKLLDTHIEFLRITYAPGGSSSGAGVLMRHQGTEYGHVLSGQLNLTLGFDSYVLRPGDSVSFDCVTPHAYENRGTEPAVGVWFVVSRFA